jgi:hypothetical protein
MPPDIQGAKYYCPYCDAETWLWSLKPITSDEWVCKGCKKRFLLDVKAIADSWQNTLAFWALFPLVVLVTVQLLLMVPKEVGKVLLALFVGVPFFPFCMFVLVYVLLIPVVLLAGGVIKAKAGNKDRRLKSIIRVIGE